MFLSLLIPFYNEEEQAALTLSVVFEQLRALDGCDYEVIVCDDGSTDHTWDCLLDLRALYPQLHCLRFSRNFGKEAAVCALIERAAGDCAILMDGDLQHPPSYIPEMLRLWRDEGWEIIDMVKIERQQENALNRFAANRFYHFFQKLSGFDLKNASDFKLLDRKALDAYRACPEQSPFFRALSAWIGFKRCSMPFEVAERPAGKSKWSPRSLMKLSTQAFTSFSAAPLNIVTWLGIIFWIFALVLGIQTLVRWVTGNAVAGFTTVILLLLITGGGIMLALGLIGTYVGRIYMESKSRPRYLLSEDLEPDKTVPAPKPKPANENKN